jgi:hypothetical protein
LLTRLLNRKQNIKEVLAPSEESTQDVYNWHKPLEAQQALADIAAEVGIADKLVVLNFTMTAARSDHHPGKVLPATARMCCHAVRL